MKEGYEIRRLAEGKLYHPPFGKGGSGGFLKQVLSYDKQLKALSQHLRKNMTDAENLLWLRLRGKQLRGLQFYRQKIIGKYIVDFYCPKANLVIELDGGQHYSEPGQEKDKTRDDVLRKMGIKVIRFCDRDVFENMDGVMERIWNCL
jgi:very-short-patch-repair endonuclease